MFGLIGKKLSHSFSKEIHEKLTMEPYTLIELDQLEPFFREKAFNGVNVTIPYKKDVMKYLDIIDESAKIADCVNTIVNRNGVLTGYNTDLTGMEYLLNKNNISVSNKSVLILGNGATSGTAQSMCLKNKAKSILVAARNPNDGEYHFTDSEIYQNTQIIINATPNGMYPNNDDPLLIDISKFQYLECVVDLVYNPLKTNLMISAQDHNIKTCNGLLMLVHQAIKACELFHNKVFEDSVTDNLYKELLLERINLVLIGMPMSGKTHYAKKLSTLYHKTFVDIDSEIENNYNTSIPLYFQKFGEDAFRDIETSTITKHSLSYNQAISTGGGAILRAINMQHLKQNGIIILLDVSLELLEKCNPKNRPLINHKDALKKLYVERQHLYREYADIIITKETLDSDFLIKVIEVKINEYLSS